MPFHPFSLTIRCAVTSHARVKQAPTGAIQRGLGSRPAACPACCRCWSSAPTYATQNCRDANSLRSDFDPWEPGTGGCALLPPHSQTQCSEGTHWHLKVSPIRWRSWSVLSQGVPSMVTISALAPPPCLTPPFPHFCTPGSILPNNIQYRGYSSGDIR